ARSGRRAAARRGRGPALILLPTGRLFALALVATLPLAAGSIEPVLLYLAPAYLLALAWLVGREAGRTPRAGDLVAGRAHGRRSSTRTCGRCSATNCRCGAAARPRPACDAPGWPAAGPSSSGCASTYRTTSTAASPGRRPPAGTRRSSSSTRPSAART